LYDDRSITGNRLGSDFTLSNQPLNGMKINNHVSEQQADRIHISRFLMAG
jgi:hypothetical protein